MDDQFCALKHEDLTKIIELHIKALEERYNHILQIIDLHIKIIETRLGDMDSALQLKTETLNDAIRIRSQELERRLEGLNQLRDEVVKDREMFLKKETYEYKTNFYDSWIREVDDKLSLTITRAEYDREHKVLDNEVRLLRESKVLLEGKASQKSLNFTIFATAISMLLASFGLILQFLHIGLK